MGLAERRRASSRIAERFYPPGRNRDARLREAIDAKLPRGGRLLDAGCGKDVRLGRLFSGERARAVGVDVGEIESTGAGIRAVRCDIASLALASGTFDVAAMRSVTEHLPDPDRAFGEIARVLRPGGCAVILCPNRWYYASVVGRLMPERAASRLLRFIFGSTVYDNFPTYYRANTRGAVRVLARRAGLVVDAAEICEHPPDYLKFSPLLFRIGIVYDRLTSRWPAFHGLAVSYLFVLRKPGIERKEAREASVVAAGELKAG